jgi:hypothetical protein
MVKQVGLFTIRIDRAKDGIVGPELRPDSSKEEFLDKIQQMINAYSVWGHVSNKERLPTFPQFEDEIKTNPIASAFYAHCFLKRPWPEAEEKIAEEKEASLFYAIKVLKRRFIAGEKEIAKSPEHCLVYSILVLKRGKLPDEMHRHMLLAAIKDPNDQNIKRYLRFKKVKSAQHV